MCSINRLFLIWGISNDQTDFREMLSLDLIESPSQRVFFKKSKVILQGQIQVLDLQKIVRTMHIPWVSAYEGDPDAQRDTMTMRLDFATECCMNCLMNKRVIAMLLQESVDGPTKGAGMEPMLLACHQAARGRRFFIFRQTKADLKRENLFKLGLKSYMSNRGESASANAHCAEAVEQWYQQYGPQFNYNVMINGRQFHIHNDLTEMKEAGKPNQRCAWAFNSVAYYLYCKANSEEWRGWFG